MRVTPYLNFRDRTREAFEFYAGVLGGEIDFIQTFGESPAAGEVPPDWGDAVMHAHLTFPGGALMASDAPGDMFKPAQGLYVSLHVDTIEEAERIWAAFRDGGTPEMDLQETFWAKRFGVVTDRFGTPWMINCAPDAATSA
jgi:PhnB protein